MDLPETKTVKRLSDFLKNLGAVASEYHKHSRSLEGSPVEIRKKQSLTLQDIAKRASLTICAAAENSSGSDETSNHAVVEIANNIEGSVHATSDIKRVVTDPNEKFCRFCFETEETPEKGNLINPCRCEGSLKHIHVECLKTWLMQKEFNSKIGSSCEICNSYYHLEAKATSIFSCARACGDGLPSLLLGLGLVVCLLNSLNLARRYYSLPHDKVQENQLQVQRIEHVMIAFCVLFSLLLLILIILNLKRAFFEKRISVSKIFNYDPNYQHQVQIVIDTDGNDDLSADLNSYDESTKRSDLEQPTNKSEYQPQIDELDHSQALNATDNRLIHLEMSAINEKDLL